MELPALPVADPMEFALRVVARPDPGAWSLLVVPHGEIQHSVAEVARGVRALDESAPILVDARGDPDRLVAEVGRYVNETLLVTGVDSFTREQWKDLDLARSRLMREGEVVVVLAPEAAADLLRYAPHLASWLSSYAWSSSAALMRAEHERRAAERLADLHAWAPDVTDDQVVSMAIGGRLPVEPEYAEWLVLLGRGDLLGTR